VVLLGASEYPRKPAWSNPVLRTSAHAVRDYVRSPAGFALTPEQVLDLFDDDTDPAGQLLCIADFLAARAATARDLVLYYVGHGGFHSDEYHLGVRRTQSDREYLTTIESRKLAQIIRDGFGRRRVYVILDSCFAASAASDWQSDEIHAAVRKMAERLPRQGTALLAAASRYDVTRAPRAGRYTVFTGAVLDVLTRGTDSTQPKLSMYELYEQVRALLRNRETDDEGRPELHVPRQGEGDVSRLQVFPNAAYSRAAAGRLQGAVARAEAAEQAATRAREEANARARELEVARAQLEAMERAAARVPDQAAERSGNAEAARAYVDAVTSTPVTRSAVAIGTSHSDTRDGVVQRSDLTGVDKRNQLWAALNRPARPRDILVASLVALPLLVCMIFAPALGGVVILIAALAVLLKLIIARARRL
jgi:hypothetical protein